MLALIGKLWNLLTTDTELTAGSTQQFKQLLLCIKNLLLVRVRKQVSNLFLSLLMLLDQRAFIADSCFNFIFLNSL